MRIVAGDHRGRALVAPKGHSTRPTADRTRQALFNILEHAAWSPGLRGLRVMDLFAGSGALGLESMSRAAEFCLFIDQQRPARDAILQNVATLKLQAVTRILDADARALTARDPARDPPFDLAFLDPPYGQGLATPALASLLAGGWLSNRAIIVVERGVGEVPATAGFAHLDTRTWGVASVDFLRRAGAAA